MSRAAEIGRKNLMNFSEKLKFARKVKGLTLREVEDKTGISNAYLSQLENGHILDPSFVKMMVLIRFYNLDVEDFAGEEPILSVKVDGSLPVGVFTWVSCSQCGTQHIQGSMCHKCYGPQ